MRRAYRPKTPEDAANGSYVHFLFDLIFKYDATTEQQGVKRTFGSAATMSAHEPKRTFSSVLAVAIAAFLRPSQALLRAPYCTPEHSIYAEVVFDLDQSSHRLGLLWFI
jgi:hypothetical protein